MKKSKAKKLLSEGYYPKVYIIGGKLKARFEHEDTNIIHPVYYNHIKSFLNDEQKRLIDIYNEVKNWTFRDDVAMNMKSKSNSETEQDIANRVVRVAIRKKEYLEQK